MIYYQQHNIVKFIPNSLFTTFKNLEYFCMRYNAEFEDLKPEFLKNASKLIAFQIWFNPITKLGENLFVEALNLVYINLENNNIESIHVLAFNKLTKLEGLFLGDNNIKVLPSETFSELTKLRYLNLESNTCIDKNFNFANGSFIDVETEILKVCKLTGIILNSMEGKLNRISSKLTMKVALRLANQTKFMNHLVLGFSIMFVTFGISGIIILVHVINNQSQEATKLDRR